MKSMYLIGTVILCLIVAASGCTTQNNMKSSVNSGNINQTNVQGVTSVALAGPGTLILKQGDTESISIQANNTDMSKITSTVTGNVLKITDTNSVSNEAVVFTVTLKNIQSVTLLGGCAGEANNIKTDKITCTLDSGKLTLTGNATDNTATVNGNGEIDAGNLLSQTATVTINGGGKATVKVKNTLNAIINGDGSINYIGNPQVNKQINGQGSVTQMDI